MTIEEFFPTRWVLHGVSRDVFAKHLQKLRKIGGNKLAKKCVYHGLWLGVIPSNWERLKCTQQ